MEKVVTFRTQSNTYDVREAMESAMTVADLKAVLDCFPSDAKVVFDNNNGFSFGEITQGRIKVADVETYEEQSDREEAEDEMESIENAINNIIKVVNEEGGNFDLGMDVVLDTLDDDHTDNLEVSVLYINDGELWGKTNWGLLNLPDTILYAEDWFTLEDIVRDLI
jgi:hypothetical protein